MQNKNLRIVILDIDDIKNPLAGGGSAQATYEYGRRLAKKGHKITVITSRFPRYKDQEVDGIFYKHIGTATGDMRINILFFILAVFSTIRRIEADIILECSTPPITTLFTPLYIKTPVIFLPTLFQALHLSKKYHLPFYLVEKMGIKFYKYVLSYTPSIDNRIKKLNPGILSHIVPQGVKREYFSIRLKKPTHILFLSRLDVAHKGIDLLLAAYSKIKNNTSLPLVIAGHGPDELLIKKLIKTYSLNDRVILSGAAYDEKKRDLISTALFTALPNKGGGMSLWALESLASGLPLVCFDVPDTRWIPESISFKARAFDADDFAQKLLLAIQTPSFTVMRSQARKFARQFSWDKVSANYEDFFYEVLERERNISGAFNN